MTVGLLVGFKAENISMIARPMTRVTGLEAELHDSLYVGDYYLFRMPEHVIVKYNFVDSTGDWEAEGFKEFGVLMRVDETDRPEYFEALARDIGFDPVVIRRTEY